MSPATRDRFLDDLLAEMGLGDADRARLTALCTTLAPQLPEIAARFYERLAANADTAALLRSPEQIARLRSLMVAWMRSGLHGPYDEAFYDGRSRIGRRHVSVGLPQQSMFTAMNLIRGEYHDRIDRLYAAGEARRVSRSVDKLLDVELALMLRHYQLDSEAKLVARERRAQSDRVRAIQTLSAGLAHEVRNPLNSAKLQLELLERRLRRSADDPRLLEPVGLVNHELDRLTRLLDAFLAFARPTEMVIETHDLAAVVRDVGAAERRIALARGADLEVRGVDALWVTGDPPKLSQIIRNLIHNAVEAVTAGGLVTVTLTGDDDLVHLVVEDDGPGFPEAVQRRIYEPFFTTKETGTGLGLSIVHGMVTLHGGTIAVVSSPRGTRFDVRLPRRPG